MMLFSLDDDDDENNIVKRRKLFQCYIHSNVLKIGLDQPVQPSIDRISGPVCSIKLFED